MSVRRLLAEVDSRELTEWMAYNALDPLGDERGDFQAAIIAATVANRWRQKGEAAHKPEDFVPKFDAEPPTLEELVNKARLLALALGGEVKGEWPSSVSAKSGTAEREAPTKKPSANMTASSASSPTPASTEP
jgi:hypothetical protein